MTSFLGDKKISALDSVQPPALADVAHLKPRNAMGFAYVVHCATLTSVALWCSWQEQIWLWLTGQILLSLALLQWFILLHEAGHRTLFRSKRLNRAVGHIAGFFSGDTEAYEYLASSISKFYEPTELLAMMKEAGFADCYHRPLTMGIVTLYVGEK